MDWTVEWPIEPGHYWFYGWRFRPGAPYRRRAPGFYYVKVDKIGDGYCYVVEGHLMYPTDSAEGMWQPVVFPTLPDGR